MENSIGENLVIIESEEEERERLIREYAEKHGIKRLPCVMPRGRLVSVDVRPRRPLVTKMGEQTTADVCEELKMYRSVERLCTRDRNRNQ